MHKLIAIAITLIVLLSCDVSTTNTPEATIDVGISEGLEEKPESTVSPVAELISTPTPTPLPTPTPTPTPTPLPTPTSTPLPTPTPTPIIPVVLEGEGETLVFSGFKWDSGIIQNGVSRYILEQGYGYSTTEVLMQYGTEVQALRNGDLGIRMEIWTPNNDWTSALQQNEVFSPGKSLENSWQSTFMIPGYVQDSNSGLVNVQDLKNPVYRALFAEDDSGGKAVLYSFEGTADDQITAYGLSDHVVLRSPESVSDLENKINTAYTNQDPLLFYYWGPSILSYNLDMINLIQPHPSNCLNLNPNLGCAYPDSEIMIGVHSDYQGNDYRELRSFLTKWDWNANSQILSEIYYNNIKNSSYNPSQDTAIWYLKNNNAWKDWVTPDAQKMIDEALSTQYLSKLTNISNNIENNYYADWSPDGSKIVFTFENSENEHIFVMNADGTYRIRLTYNGKNRRPSWSPDGAKIAFDSDRGDNDSFSGKFGSREIYVMNSDGTNEIRLTNDSYDDYKPSWSPDGTKIVFTSEKDGLPQINTMNSDGTDQINISNNNVEDSNPSWSPDGSKIVFTSKRDGNMEIYTMNVDGTNQLRLTNNDSLEYKPVWSHDGTKIAFTSERDGNAEIYIMNAAGTKQTRLTNTFDIDEWATAWSPDGSKIAFESDRNGNWQIFVMDNIPT